MLNEINEMAGYFKRGVGDSYFFIRYGGQYEGSENFLRVFEDVGVHLHLHDNT